VIEDLVAVVRRSWKSLDRVQGVDFVLHCFPFLDGLSRDPRVNTLLADFRREERESRAAFEKVERTVRQELLALIDDVEAVAPAAFLQPPADRLSPDFSANALRRRLQPQPRTEDDEAWLQGRERDDHDNRRLDGAIAIVSGAIQREGAVDPVDEPAFNGRLGEIEVRFEHAERVRRTAFRTSAGAALERVERDLRDLHPPPTVLGMRAFVQRMAEVDEDRPLGRILERAFGRGEQIDDGIPDPVVDARLARMRRDMQRVVDELVRRLGAERSLLAVVERYRQRAQWYDAARLQAIAAKGPGKAEDRLTETLATYLFDHGLNPLTRPLAGLLQPDLLGQDSRFSFYVEAKQYKASTTSVRTYLREGMHQVWDMLGQLQGSGFDVVEAFYIVYRRGGPRYTFPPRLQHGRFVVHILMIDLAPSSERGSRAPQTFAFDAADLMPRPVTHNQPAPRRRRGRAA
jgi:hypothetical protein